MNRSLDKWLEIGTVVSAQGLRGELRVYPSSDFPERFLVAGRRWLQNPHTGKISSVELIKGRHIEKKNLYVITLAEINDRNQAEEVRGYKLLVEKSDRLPLEED
ncbi:MAG: 16S rRNA processing protein RimM, partial [Cyanobacteria bacterium J083]